MPLYRGSRRLLLRRRISAVAGGDPFALDGTPVTNNTGAGSSMNLTGFSTTYANDIVYVAFTNNGGLPTTPTGGGLTFTQRTTYSSGGTTISLYSAMAAAPLSSVTVVCAQATVDFMTGLVFAFSGVKASPNQFDTNGSIPNGGTAAGCPFTTNNANDILIAACVDSGSAGGSFIDLSATSASNFCSVGYQIVSATQSGLTAFGGSGSLRTVIDATVKGP